MRLLAERRPRAEAEVEGSTETYFREIVRHELLTAHEEVALAQQLEAGKAATAQLTTLASTLSQQDRLQFEQLVDAGHQAQRRLIECNLRLVVSVARRYLGLGLSLLDLVQEGSIGLQIGVDKYDWQRGFRLKDDRAIACWRTLPESRGLVRH